MTSYARSFTSSETVSCKKCRGLKIWHGKQLCKTCFEHEKESGICYICSKVVSDCDCDPCNLCELKSCPGYSQTYNYYVEHNNLLIGLWDRTDRFRCSHHDELLKCKTTHLKIDFGKCLYCILEDRITCEMWDWTDDNKMLCGSKVMEWGITDQLEGIPEIKINTNIHMNDIISSSIKQCYLNGREIAKKFSNSRNIKAIR